MLEKILTILWEWRFIILLAVAGMLYCLFEWERAKTFIYAGIAQAKRYAKDQVLKNGNQQEEYVVKLALQYLPLSLKIFLSEKLIRRLVKSLYSKLGDYIDDGILNDTYKLE
ncbi:MAG: Uncharacterized protein K0R80_2906 [Clostridia bacterium]|jgi:hypothetical protein|nr:Uncharacterized protein [Clostridia bacterium]